MLKHQLLKQKSLDLKQYVLEFSEFIKNVDEKQVLLDIIFNKSHRVKCIQSWKQTILSDALVKIMSINNELKLIEFKDPASIHLKNHMLYIYDTLKNIKYLEEENNCIAHQVILLHL